jgi:hypothetical protein
MSDVIKTKIAKTNDRHEAFQLLLELGVPLSVLEVTCTSGKGEIWVENSQRIFRATLPGMENGMMALMAMLAGKDPEFRLRLEEVEKPKENVNIDLLALITDEQKIIQRLKDILWPVNPVESEILTEASIPAIPLEVLKEQYKRVQEREAEVQDFSPPTPAAELVPNGTGTGAQASADSGAPASSGLSDPGPQASSLPSSEPSSAYVHPSEESPAEVAPQKLPEDFESLTEDVPAHLMPGSNITARPESPSEGDTAPEPVAQDPQETPAASADLQPASAQSIDDSDLAAEREALEQMVLAAQPPVTSSELDVVIETKTYSSVGEEIPVSDRSAQLVTNVTDNDPDSGLSDKQRAEMRALEVWCGEEPEKFYEPGEAPVEEDDIIDHRKAEMDALSAMLAAHSDLQRVAFEDIEPQKPDPESDKRRREYEAINEYFGEAPEKFYEQVELGEEDPLGQEELRLKVLKAMETQTDPEAFHEVDETLQDNSALRPRWDGEQPEPAEMPVELPDPIMEANKGDDYVPPDLEPSAFGDDVSKLNFEEKHKNMLNMTDPSQDSKSLLDRPPDKANKYAKLDKDKIAPREKIPPGLLIGGVVFAAIMPLIGLYLYNYFNMNAQADYEDQQAAAMLASDAAEEESLANKPQEAFRLPDAQRPPAKPPASSGTPNEKSHGFVTEEELNTYKWKAPARPAPQPTAAAIADGNRSMALGDQMMSLGKTDEAARHYSDGLLKCPTNSQLRLRCARAYIALGEYQTAKVILLAGMNDAANQSEFYMFLAVLKELPRE